MIIAPAPADVGDTLVMLGIGRTVKFTPLLEIPETVTTTFPVAAFCGTATEMLVAVQLVGEADHPPKVTELEPCVEPKFVPVIVMMAPTGPKLGDKLVMEGACRTVKPVPLLSTPLA